MKRWWIGVALAAVGLGLHVPAWGQAPAPMPAPLPSGRSGTPAYGVPPAGPGSGFG